MQCPYVAFFCISLGVPTICLSRPLTLSLLCFANVPIFYSVSFFPLFYTRFFTSWQSVLHSFYTLQVALAFYFCLVQHCPALPALFFKTYYTFPAFQ